MFKDAKVLVTGGAGFVGTNLILRLLDMGAKVTATIHKKDPQIQDSRVNFIRAELLNPADCEKVCAGQDYVFMCAANTSGAGVMATTPLVHLTPNVVKNVQMLDAAYKAGVKKFCFLSSNTVYPLTDYPVKEEDCIDQFYEKYHIVAWMKRFTEIVCEMYDKKIGKPMKCCVVRPGNIYGEYDDFEWATSHVIPALVRKVAERQSPLEVWGDGKDLKDFVYISDFIDGMLAAFEKIDGYDPINIAGGNSVTVRDVLGHLQKAAGYEDATIKYLSDKPTMIPKRLISIDRAKKVLGWEPKVPIAEGLKRTLDWYKANPLPVGGK
jgi:GDP-L-fucose synthase